MAALHQLPTNEVSNPLDRIERLALANDWFIDRSGDDEITLLVGADWGDLHLCLNWRDDIEGLHLACTFDQRAPQLRREDVARLFSLVNEQLYFGHFDIWRQDGSIVFRNGLILAGGAEVTEAQCEALIRIAIEACERYYPAMQFVIWAGKSPEEAVAASLFETVGEA